MSRKKIILGILSLIIVLGLLVSFVTREEAPEQGAAIEPVVQNSAHAVIGYSVQGRVIEAFTYGSGTAHLLFVGGMHGGYEWNSVLLAYTALDYLGAHPELVPENLAVTVIPSANPDGVYKIIGKEGRFTLSDAPSGNASAGRFNANGVDLNRNFDCAWKPESMWKDKVVSAGTAAFSEPEAAALRDFVLKTKPSAAVFWHSQANAVYASACTAGVLPQTLTIMHAYAGASGYPAVTSFGAYEVTGDAEGWLASIGIPAITVELSTHETLEWQKNLAGMKALFAYFGKE